MIADRRISVRAQKSPYIVFAAIIGPIIVLTLYDAFYVGARSALEATVILTFMLGLILFYFRSLKLELADGNLVYRAMWRSRSISLENIQAIDRRHGALGLGVLWIVRSKGGTPPFSANVTNFNGLELRALAQALVERAPTIRFTALRL